MSSLQYKLPFHVCLHFYKEQVDNFAHLYFIFGAFRNNKKVCCNNDNKIHITPTILHLYILKVHAENMPLLFFLSSALAQLLDLDQLCIIMKY